VRAVPAKLPANRLVINNQLPRTRGGKISFTHLIGFAVVRALAELPVMNRYFTEREGKAAVVTPDHVKLGCESMNLAQFRSAYEVMMHRARLAG
jgi:2-oxoglutarate decarboxylase